MGCFSGCEVASQCGFDLHSLMSNDVVHLFHVLIGYLYSFFEEMFVSSTPLLIFTLGGWIFVVEL